MATRLQSDEAGKESKWADIDDDEDDWAPDTVEWMDGTKSSVEVAAKSIKPAAEISKPSKVKPDVLSEHTKQLTNNQQDTQNAPVQSTPPSSLNVSSQTKLTTSSITNKTVLKPGSQPSIPPTQLRSGGLVLKASTEKPSLTVKQTAPLPTKSPWAPLPPISKMSPVAISPSVQAQQPYSAPTSQARYGQRENQAIEAMLPPPSPAKEIAADDFNRSWRDDRGNKELFNSQSGRYEPVNSRRRSSARMDQGYRQPAVLQRPSQPAQPSPVDRTPVTTAVQETDGSERHLRNRRRASSNISGGSFSQLRRPSINVPDTLEDDSSNKSPIRNTGVADNAHVKAEDRKDEEPLSDNLILPEMGPVKAEQSSMARVEPNGSGTQLITQAKSMNDPEPQQSNVDYVSIQRQVMREKTELARARKREEEEKEEAAKKERIRLKLESLGLPLPEQQDQKQDQKLDAELNKKPVESPLRQTRKPIKKVDAVSASSPPKPPIPTSVGEVTQYGMMKVHQPQPLRKAIVSDTHGLDKQSTERLYGQHLVQPNEDRARLSRSISPLKSPKKPFRDGSDTSAGTTEQPRHQTERLKPSSSPSKPSAVDHWKHSKKAADPLNGWTNSSVPAHSLPGGNVWGAPNTLGNGTFDGGYGRMAPRPLQHQQHAQPTQSTPPGPIAPPNFVKAARAAQSGSNASTAQDTAVNSNTITDSAVLQSRNQQYMSEPSEQRLSAGKSGTLMSQNQIALPRSGDQASNYGISAWKNLPLQLKETEKEEKERLDREYRNTPRKEFQNASFKETFVKTGKAIGPRGERSVLKTELKYHSREADSIAAPNGAKLSPETKLSQTVPTSNNLVDGLSLRGDAHLAPINPHVGLAPAHPAQQYSMGRPLSRFFPRSQENISQVAQVTDPNAPPPPDPFNHPAYAGDHQHPVVHLPIPKAVVKLPPPTLAPSPKVSSSASAPAIRLGSQPIVNQTAWQDRFDDLLNRKPAPNHSPPRDQAYAVTSASKAPLDVLSTPVTVLLPVHDELPRILGKFPFPLGDQGSSVVSKPILEDLAEPLPFASRPPVCLPKAPFINSTRLPFPFMRYIQQPVKTQIASMLTPLYFLEEGERTSAGYRIQIRLPGREARKAVILPVSRPHQPSYGRRKSHGKAKDTQMSRTSVKTMKAAR